MRQVTQFFLLVASVVFCSKGTFAQVPEYHESASGLEKLAKDIMKAQRENNGAKAGALLDTMVLPNYEQWYRENFDDETVDRVLPTYAANAQSMPMQLAKFFLQAQAQNFTNLEAKRFEKNCDDNASEQTFNTLDARLKEVPLYELRFINGTQFQRLFAFAYVEGPFRYVLTPDFGEAEPRRSGAASAAASPRVKEGGSVQAAKLIAKVPPIYPEIARQEHLSGMVRLHAIIDKDGTVKTLRVISGRCSLARASIDAVRKWRYRPMLLNGSPVEVDTTIDVFFTMRQ